MPKHSGSHKGNKKSASMRSHEQKSGRAKNSSKASSKHQKSQEINLPENTSSKKGCGTKVLTLLLPFIAVGGYLILRS
jgi:hypothetical protein